MHHLQSDTVLPQIPRAVRRSALLALLGVLAFAPASSRADGMRSPQDVARGELMRLHVRLTRDAMNAPEIADARDAATRAYALLYQVRENVLGPVRALPDYADLKLALWHQQRQLEGLHDEVPVSVQKILATATDSLSIRGRINKIEAEALEADDTYLAARDDLNAKINAYRQALRDAADHVRFDPEFVAMSARLRSMARGHGHASSGNEK